VHAKLRAFSFQFLEHSPRALGFCAEEYDFVLAFIQVESQARFDVAFALTKKRARNVIDMDHEDAAFGVGELNEFHSGASSKEVGAYARDRT